MKKLIFFLIVIDMAAHANAQSVGPSIINSSGGGGVINSQRFDYSVGEMTVVSTFTSASLVVTQGVLQPPASGEGVPQVNPLQSGLSVYPNPASDVVYLQPSLGQNTKLEYDLLDVSGKVILGNAANLQTGNEKQSLRVSGLPAGSYILRVTATQKGETFSGTYKIQKLN